MSLSKHIKILFLDIETAPILGYVWTLWENNVALNQIKSDWYVLSWAAKWLDDSEVHYMDQRNSSNMEDDKKILKGIWKLINDADVVVTQNGKAFDAKKLNARFIMNGFKPPSSFKHIDTKQIAKKHFAFTSNRLEYMTDKLCVKYKKLKHHKFEGFELWKECLARNPKAWQEMEKYNKHDVLSLEELYSKLIPWDTSFNPNVYIDGVTNYCTCGSSDFVKNGFAYTLTGKFQKYQCNNCGAPFRSKENELSELRRMTLKKR